VPSPNCDYLLVIGTPLHRIGELMQTLMALCIEATVPRESI